MAAKRAAHDRHDTASSQRLVEYSTLLLAGDVTRRLSDEDDCRHEARRFARAGFDRIWLEALRDGHVVDLRTLRRARDVFREEGLIVSGAVTTTTGHDGRGFGAASNRSRVLLCYSATETRQALARLSGDVCALFDEVMYDDFLFTDCRCDRCTAQKGDRSWAEYRCEMRSRVARDFVVKPGHERNPDCTIIVKYPQWYDRLHAFGYDVLRDTAAFDQIWIGTETRGLDTPAFGYVPTYQSTVIYQWLGGIGGAKTRGGWFDFQDCTPDEYVDQAYCTVLNGAHEIVLWHAYASLPDGAHAPLMAALAEHRQPVDALAGLIHHRDLLGLPAYKPPNSAAGDEDYWLDYFGNLGIPLLACAEFPRSPTEASLVLTRAARHDAAIDRRAAAWAASGGSLIATAGFLADAGDEVRQLFGIDRIESRPAEARTLLVDGKAVALSRPVSLGGMIVPGGAAVRVAAQVDAGSAPVLTTKRTAAGGMAVMLSLRTHEVREGGLMTEPVSWIDLPLTVVNVIREVALIGTGLHVEAPGRVIVHPFSGNLVSLMNTSDTAAPVILRVSPPWFRAEPRGAVIHPAGQRLDASSDGGFRFTMPPHARWLVAFNAGRDPQ